MNQEIETGVEYENDVRDVDAEVYGYVDDGEHAVVWAVWEESEGEYHVNVYNCEAGLCDDIYAFTGDLSEHESVEEVARSLATDDPEGAIEASRDYWN